MIAEHSGITKIPKPCGGNCRVCSKPIDTTVPAIPAVAVAGAGTTCGLPSCVAQAIDLSDDFS